MRKLNLANYLVEARDKESGELVDTPYDVKKSIINILFHPDLQLQASEVLERDKLANRILDCSDGFALLEDAEYSKVKQAIEVVRGLTRHDVELVRRILEAEEVKVEEKR